MSSPTSSASPASNAAARHLARAIAAVGAVARRNTTIIAFADPLPPGCGCGLRHQRRRVLDDTLKTKSSRLGSITRRQMLINLGKRCAASRQTTGSGVASSGYKRHSGYAGDAWPRLHHHPGPAPGVNGANAIPLPQVGSTSSLRRDGIHLGRAYQRALAHVAQHRDDALAAQIGAKYLAEQHDLHRVDAHHIFDCDARTIGIRPTDQTCERRTACRLNALATAILTAQRADMLTQTPTEPDIYPRPGLSSLRRRGGRNA